MDLKTCLANEAERLFILKCIRKQNLNRYTTFKIIVLKTLALLMLFGMCLALICWAASHLSKNSRIEPSIRNPIHLIDKNNAINLITHIGNQ